MLSPALKLDSLADMGTQTSDVLRVPTDCWETLEATEWSGHIWAHWWADRDCCSWRGEINSVFERRAYMAGSFARFVCVWCFYRNGIFTKTLYKPHKAQAHRQRATAEEDLDFFMYVWLQNLSPESKGFKGSQWRFATYTWYAFFFLVCLVHNKTAKWHFKIIIIRKKTSGQPQHEIQIYRFGIYLPRLHKSSRLQLNLVGKYAASWPEIVCQSQYLCLIPPHDFVLSH